MNRSTAVTMTAGVFGLALATSAVAQQAPDFPAERDSTASCDAVNWNASMLTNHPRLIGACQEVVVINSESWARFDAGFSKIERDGRVVFNVVDRRDRPIEEVSFMPTTGQVAYLDNRATPFQQLRSTDRISLYVPEGQYGFSTQAGVPREQVAQIIEPATPVVTDQAVAQTSTRPTTRAAVLPATASSMPWFALAGFLSMLGGMILTIRR